MLQTEVWAHEEILVSIYESDRSGMYSEGTPVFENCFCQSVSVSASNQTEKRLRSASKTRETVQVNAWDSYRISISELYLGKERSPVESKFSVKGSYFAIVFSFLRQDCQLIEKKEALVCLLEEAEFSSSEGQNVVQSIKFHADIFRIKE